MIIPKYTSKHGQYDHHQEDTSPTDQLTNREIITETIGLDPNVMISF